MKKERIFALIGTAIVLAMVVVRVTMAFLGMDIHFRWQR
jgi:hypothetical protein